MIPSNLQVTRAASFNSSSVSVANLYPSLAKIVGQRAAPASKQQETPRERFQRLATRWREETMFLSSLTQICAHQDYLAIIGMGERALPMIFEDLAHGADLWGPALAAITGVSLPAEAGNIEAIGNAWLDWGRTHGYVK